MQRRTPAGALFSSLPSPPLSHSLLSAMADRPQCGGQAQGRGVRAVWRLAPSRAADSGLGGRPLFTLSTATSSSQIYPPVTPAASRCPWGMRALSKGTGRPKGGEGLPLSLLYSGRRFVMQKWATRRGGNHVRGFWPKRPKLLKSADLFPSQAVYIPPRSL